MKLKAFYVAVALVVTIGPAGADGLLSPGRGVEVAQSEPSRLYRAEWLSAQAPSTAQTSSHEVEAPLFTAATRDVPDADAGDAASAEISDALKAKIRAIVAIARDDARNTADGSKLLRSRIRVRCSVRQVVAKHEPSLTAMPALMLSERAGAGPARVTSTVEACTIKLLQIRRSESSEPAKRDFSIELPASLSDTAH